MRRGMMLKHVAAAILIIIVVMMFSVAYGRVFGQGTGFGIGLVDGARAFLGLEIKPHPARLLGISYELGGSVQNPVVHAVLRVGLPANQILYCNDEPAGGPHTSRNDEIVTCRIPIIPTDKPYGNVKFRARTELVSDDPDSEGTTSWPVGPEDFSVDYLSRALVGVTAETVLYHISLNIPPSDRSFSDANSRQDEAHALCQAIGKVCTQFPPQLCDLDAQNPFHEFLKTDGIFHTGIIIDIRTGELVNCKDADTMRECMNNEYLPALREALSVCAPKPGVWVTNDHFIITDGLGGGYAYVNPTSRYFFTSVDYREDEQTHVAESSLIDKPVSVESVIVPFVILNVPAEETVQEVLIDLGSHQDSRSVRLSYSHVMGGTQGYSRAVYRADALENLRPGRYSVTLHIRDSQGARSFDGAPLSVFRPLPYLPSYPWFYRAPDHRVPHEETDGAFRYVYVPDRIHFLSFDSTPGYDSATISFDVYRTSSTETTFHGFPIVLNREIVPQGTLAHAHQTIATEYRDKFEGFEDTPSSLTISEEVSRRIDHNEARAIDLAQQLGFVSSREERWELIGGRWIPILADLNAWTRSTFGITIYGNTPQYGDRRGGFLVLSRRVIYPNAMRLVLDELQRYDPNEGEARKYISLVPDAGIRFFDNDHIVLINMELRSGSESDVLTFNPLILDAESIEESLINCRIVFDSQTQIWAEHTEHRCAQGSYCVPMMRLPTKEEHGVLSQDREVSRLDSGLCMGQARRGVLVYDQRICESGLTEHPITAERWARCV